MLSQWSRLRAVAGFEPPPAARRYASRKPEGKLREEAGWRHGRHPRDAAGHKEYNEYNEYNEYSAETACGCETPRAKHIRPWVRCRRTWARKASNYTASPNKVRSTALAGFPVGRASSGNRPMARCDRPTVHSEGPTRRTAARDWLHSAVCPGS